MVRLGLGPFYRQSFEAFRCLKPGDRILVLFMGSSYSVYGGDAAKPPQREAVYVALRPGIESGVAGPTSNYAQGRNAGPNIRLEVRAEKGGQRATLFLRPTGEFANTILLIRRDKHGAHTSGSWVHLRPAPHATAVVGIEARHWRPLRAPGQRRRRRA